MSDRVQTTERRWRFKGPEMEGAVARWYAGIRSSGSQIQEYRRQALQLTQDLAAGADVLEGAPGPGYLDIELEVKKMELGRLSGFMTMATLEMLKRRAYSTAQFERLAAESPFACSEIWPEGIGLEIRLTKQGEKTDDRAA